MSEINVQHKNFHWEKIIRNVTCNLKNLIGREFEWLVVSRSFLSIKVEPFFIVQVKIKPNV